MAKEIHNRLNPPRASAVGTPIYALLHLRVGWRVNDHVTLNGALENLTNAEYRNHGASTNPVSMR